MSTNTPPASERSDGLLVELRGLGLTVERGWFDTLNVTTPTRTLRVTCHDERVDVVELTAAGMAGITAPLASLHRMPALTVAGIIAGWVESHGVNLGPGSL